MKRWGPNWQNSAGWRNGRKRRRSRKSKLKTGIQRQIGLFDLEIEVPVTVQLINEFLDIFIGDGKELHSLEIGDNLMLNGALQRVAGFGLEFDSLVGS